MNDLDSGKLVKWITSELHVVKKMSEEWTAQDHDSAWLEGFVRAMDLFVRAMDLVKRRITNERN